MTGIITDLNGDTYNYYEKSGIHLENTEYNMSLSQTFINYIKGVQYERIL